MKWEKDAVNGYRHFMALAEWYRLRTPFSQWFSKNMAGVFCPFADSLMMDPVGHVSLTRLYESWLFLHSVPRAAAENVNWF